LISTKQWIIILVMKLIYFLYPNIGNDELHVNSRGSYSSVVLELTDQNHLSSSRITVCLYYRVLNSLSSYLLWLQETLSDHQSIRMKTREWLVVWNKYYFLFFLFISSPFSVISKDLIALFYGKCNQFDSICIGIWRISCSLLR